MNLERAISIATEAHADQFDKAGAPYISHPLRVMRAQDSEEARIVAVLHDVVEDSSGWTFDRLEQEGFSSTIIEALRLVTKINGEDYNSFVGRAASNPISRAVKIADIQDNMDLSRIANVTTRDIERIEKYRRALALLQPEQEAHEVPRHSEKL